MIGAIAALIIGFALLVVAADRFVGGAAGASLRLRVPAVVVGAIVIGFGTSTPELLTSVLAAAEGSREIAVGNIVGSNLANLTLVLGVVAILGTPAVTSRVLRREVPVTVVAMLGLAAALEPFTRVRAAVLLVGFAAAIVLVLRTTRLDGADVLGDEVHREIDPEAQRPWRVLAAEIGGGLLGTVLGAQLLVSSARSLAERLDVGEGLVGFTLVALGTSLPEVVTAIHAARRDESDLAIGNVLGSNLFNALVIGGVTGLIAPGAIDGGLVLVAWASVPVAAAAGVLMWTSRRLVRWEGAALLATYGASLPIVA